MRYYWLDGFYVYPINESIPEGAVEISEEEYHRLLYGQGADGEGGNLEIYTREDGYPDLRLRVEPPLTPAAQIEALKCELSSTDYRVIKCMEASLLGRPMPYDVAALHAERQALRDRINELESEI
jgi:hypothetical protein